MQICSYTYLQLKIYTTEMTKTDAPNASKSPSRLEDLARLAGVSVATVSRALNDSNLISDRTKKRILSLAEEHNYAGRTQFTPRGSTISAPVSVLLPHTVGHDIHLSNPFIMELIGGIGDALWERGEELVITHLPADGSCRDFSPDAGAFIVLGQYPLLDELNQLARNGVRVVAWGEQYRDIDYCTVGSDNFRGSYRATSHLARLGRTRIAFVGDTEIGEAGLRFQGYRQALDDVGLDFDPQLVMPCLLFADAGHETVESALARGLKFDAVAAGCDALAFGAIRALVERGMDVPNDVSVVGYDDVPLATWYNPPLTTVRQDTAKAGRQLVRKAMRLLQGEEVQSSYLPTDLIVRQSCGA